MKMPVLFIGHGSPMNIITDNEFTRSLAKLGPNLPRPEVILVISAHWLTEGTLVCALEKPRTIHDFGGFPEQLYRQHYPSPGSPQTARLVSEIIKNPRVEIDESWGLDHAAWAVLKHMYPKADIPVVEMSLDYSPYNGWNKQSLRYFYEIGGQLAPLREKGVLIIGSGNIVHNLRFADMENLEAAPYAWAVEYDTIVKEHLLARNHEALLDCRNMSRASSLSIPTLDHYLPMVFTLALQEPDEPLTFIYEGFQNRSVSMRCFKIGKG